MPARKILVSTFVALASVLGLVAVGPSSPAVAACSISTSLRLGSSGEPVRCLQSTLNAQGYSAGPVDGSFGPMTYRAVTRYQQAKRLFVDGIVGRQTGTALGIWGDGVVAERRHGPAAAPAAAVPAARSTPCCAAARRARRCAASSRG